MLRSLFLATVDGTPEPTQRAILDAYFSAFFAAWHDRGTTGRERCIAGFLPMLLVVPESVAGYWSDYPDGRVVTLVRDPRAWWVSARAHLPDYRDLDTAIAIWSRSAEASLTLGAQRPDRVLLSTYERLVTRTEETMRQVADFLGIDFHPTLTMPTYLGQPVRPNSSFAVDGLGVGRHGLDRVGDLTPAELKRFPGAALALYARAEAAASRRLG